MTASLKSLKLSAIGFCSATIALSTGFASVSQAQMADGMTGDTVAPASQVAQGAPSIVEIATSAGAFDTLVAALQAADLVEALSGEGPLTVFAPIDDAFEALPDGVLAALLKPENKDLLTQILTYHVVEGGVLSSDLSTGDVTALSGNLMVDVSDDGVKVNDAQVLRADIQGSNGVIHVINQVLVPEAVASELANRLAAADDMASDDMASDDMSSSDMASDDMAGNDTMSESTMMPEASMAGEQMAMPEASAPAPAAPPVRALW